MGNGLLYGYGRVGMGWGSMTKDGAQRRTKDEWRKGELGMEDYADLYRGAPGVGEKSGGGRGKGHILLPAVAALACCATSMQRKPNGEEKGASKQQGGKGSGRKWRRRRQGQPLLPEGSAPTTQQGANRSVFAGGGGSATPPMSHRAERRLESSFEDSSFLPGSRGKADCAAEHRDSARYWI